MHLELSYRESLKYQILLRSNRGIASVILFPEDPISALATSEILSFIEPMINSIIRNQLLGLIYSLMYAPSGEFLYIYYFVKTNIINIQAEICFLLFLIASKGIEFF